MEDVQHRSSCKEQASFVFMYDSSSHVLHTTKNHETTSTSQAFDFFSLPCNKKNPKKKHTKQNKTKMESAII